MAVQIKLRKAQRYTYRGMIFLVGKTYEVDDSTAKKLLSRKDERGVSYFVRPDYEARIAALRQEAEAITLSAEAAAREGEENVDRVPDLVEPKTVNEAPVELVDDPEDEDEVTGDEDDETV